MSQITAFDRLVACSKGEILDRIPVFCNLFDQGVNFLKLSPKEYYLNGEMIAEAQLLLREKYNFDNVWCFSYVGREAELFGSRKVIFSKNGPPNVGEMIIKEFKDIEKLEVPKNILDTEMFIENKKCIDTMLKSVDKKFPICAYVTSGMTLPILLMGVEKWIDLLINGPIELRDRILEITSEVFRMEVDGYKKLGVNLIIYSNPFASTDFMPLKQIENEVLKWMRIDLKDGTENLVFYCGGSKIKDSIKIVRDEFNFGTYYLGPLDNIDQCMSNIDNKGVGVGVINDIKLINTTKEIIRDNVKEMILSGAKYKKFAIGTLGMPLSIPEENIKIMLDSAYEFGSREFLMVR